MEFDSCNQNGPSWEKKYGIFILIVL